MQKLQTRKIAKTDIPANFIGEVSGSVGVIAVGQKGDRMDDIISRQAAIDEIKERFNAARNWYKEIQDNNGDEIMLARAETTLIDFTECSLMLKKLPSVQPEQKEVANDKCKIYRANN